MKINSAQSKAPLQSLLMIRRSNTKALQYIRQIELDDPTPLPESALLIATAQIMHGRGGCEALSH